MSRKRQNTSLIEIIIISLLKGLWFLISWPIKKILKIKDQKPKINKIENLKKWLEIEKLLESDDEIHARHAVVEADKLFNSMMEHLGAKGESFADRLRSLENRFSSVVYQKVWSAHKVRNQISHEIDYKLSMQEAKKTLDDFRVGLHNLGAL